MPYTIYEHGLTMNNQPAEPAKKRTASQALGAAFSCDRETRYVVIVPDENIYFRTSISGAAATAADHKCLAGNSYGFPIRKVDGPNVVKLYAITAP